MKKKYFFATDKKALEKLEIELNKYPISSELGHGNPEEHMKSLVSQNTALIEFFLSLREVD